MPRPMPVDPRFSRRLSILNSIPSDFSSSLSRPMSSRRMSSLVVPLRSSLIASSLKNSRSSIVNPVSSCRDAHERREPAKLLAHVNVCQMLMLLGLLAFS